MFVFSSDMSFYSFLAELKYVYIIRCLSFLRPHWPFKDTQLNDLVAPKKFRPPNFFPIRYMCDDVAYMYNDMMFMCDYHIHERYHIIGGVNHIRIDA